MNKATTTTGGIWLALGSMRRSERKGLFRMAMGTVRAKLIRLPGLLAGVWMSWAAMGETRPNLLFVFSDDQSFDTIRATGNREVSTPNLDRLVSEGTLFTHAYNMGSWSGAVCIPSRTMLNTGRFLWPTRRLHQDMAPELEAGRFWAQRLQRVGYRTYFTGKWHVSADVNRIFGVTGTVRGGMPRDTPEGYNRPRTDQPDPWSPWDPRFGGFWEGGRHWSEVVGDDALRFLGVAQEESEPFFMYIAFNAPHDPRQSPQEFVERYPVDEIRVPANYLPEYPYAEAIGCGPGLRDERLAPFPRSEHAVRVHRQEYYAIITHMDAQVGRILDEVERAATLSLRLNPTDEQNMVSVLGTALLRLGKDDQVLRLARDNPDNGRPELAYGRAIVLFRQDRKDDAESAMVEAMESFPLVCEYLFEPEIGEPDEDDYEADEGDGFTFDDANVAWDYVRMNRKLWESVPGLMEWADELFDRLVEPEMRFF